MANVDDRQRQWLPFSLRSWSISMRLAVWYGSSIMVLLVGFSVLTYINFHNSLHRDFDRHLVHEYTVLLPLVEFDANGPTFSRFEAMRTVAYQTDGILGTYVRLFDAEGRIRYQSPNFEGHPELPIELPELPEETFSGRLWQDGPLRTHFHPLFVDENRLAGWLEVSGFEWSMHQELRRLMQTFAIGIMVCFLLAIAGGYLLARRALRPVSSITRVANEIQAANLDRRVPVEGPIQDELSQLANTINGLLERIQSSFLRERRFSANAAHELLTPLAAVRAEMELALREPGLPVSLRLAEALGDIDRMDVIVRSLLELSSAERLDQANFVALDLGKVIGEHLGRFEDRALVEGKTISHQLADGCFVRADRDGLGTIIDNLVDNALKYTDEGHKISVALATTRDGTVLTVSDDGIGFTREDSEHLFDRFFRANTAGTKARPGSGLGLAIVSVVVEAFGGSVAAFSPGLGRGSSFRVWLPDAL